VLSSLARYCPIHRRTHQRVAELEPIGTHANEVCRLGGDKTTLVDVQLGCGAGNRPPATGALRRGIKSIARAGGGSRSTRSRYACSSDVGVGSALTSGPCPQEDLVQGRERELGFGASTATARRIVIPAALLAA